MKKHYDFSKGVRGKFYRPNAKFNLPVYLDPEVEQFVEKIAKSKGVEVSSVVNDLLKSNMRLAEVMQR
jgi:hypothetical protein